VNDFKKTKAKMATMKKLRSEEKKKDFSKE
jgi:hypothetical protein